MSKSDIILRYLTNLYMGLDYPSLEPYGGFEGLLERIKSGNVSGSAEQDFAHILYLVLTKGRSLDETELRGRRDKNHLKDEFETGIRSMAEDDRTAVEDVLKSMFD